MVRVTADGVRCRLQKTGYKAVKHGNRCDASPRVCQGHCRHDRKLTQISPENSALPWLEHKREADVSFTGTWFNRSG